MHPGWPDSLREPPATISQRRLVDNLCRPFRAIKRYIQILTLPQGTTFNLQRLQRGIEKYYEEDIREIQHYKMDFPIRLLVYGLILLQYIKLCTVTRAPFIQFVGFLYPFSWFSVEAMFFAISQPAELSDIEMECAHRLWSRSTISQALVWISEELSVFESKTEIGLHAVLYQLWLLLSGFMGAFLLLSLGGSSFCRLWSVHSPYSTYPRLRRRFSVFTWGECPTPKLW